jgi:sporulation protein YlmC with PRC-barrel domain
MQRIRLLASAAALATLSAGTLAQASADPSRGTASQLPSTSRPMSATPGTPGDAPRTTPGAKSSGVDPSSAAPTTKSLHDWERGHRGSKIIGTDVRNRKNEKIGAVKDIVLDDKGAVAYAVVATGTFLGMRDKMHAVPWAALQTNAVGKDFFVLDIDKAKLATVPGFDDRSWPDFGDARWNAENRKHFGAP